MKTFHPTKKVIGGDLKYETVGHPSHLLFDTTYGNGMTMLDSEGNIISWNAIAERMLGFRAKEVVGKNYSIFFTKEDNRKKIFEKAIARAANKGNTILEGIRIRKNGSRFWARSFISLVKQGRRGSEFFVLVTQDITHEKALAQKREEYIGVASHELKNPIAVLSLYSELLAKRLELDRDKKNLLMLRDIQGQATRLVTLVDDLLTVSKIEGGKLELHKVAFNPNTFFKKLIQDFQKTTSTHKIILSSSVKSEVYADKERITQVFINLITNAVKYSPLANKVLIHLEHKGGKCVVSVQDFGSGIAQKDQRDIFTRFFRSDGATAGSAAGLGLGLYISKGIMKKHREKLWVTSVENKGTTFFFTLSSI